MSDKKKKVSPRRPESPENSPTVMRFIMVTLSAWLLMSAHKHKDDPENHHRLLPDLWGLYPGYEITPDKTAEFTDAARKSLDFRGDGSVGWSTSMAGKSLRATVRC